MEKNTRKRKIMVIGHKNPDTDSICAAISYSYLKNKISDTYHEPRRAGEINQETAFVLQKFGMPTPRLCENVSPQVRDIDIREVEGVAGGTTMRAAWETMRDKDVTSLPILNEDEHLLGLVTLQDIAMANMDSLDPRTISNAGTSLRNVIDTLDGNLVVGDPETRLSGGKVVIGAGSPDVLEQSMDEGDIVLLANRYDTQLCAIEMNAALIIICGAPDVAKTIVKLATMNSCAIITTPYDTYQASFLLNQSIPVEHFMQRNIKSFSLLTTVEDARKLMGQVRYNYFPIVNGDGKYCGLISKRNLLNFKRKKLILVDHNERTQCVDGYEEAEILEIIDHHRIGTLETNGPVYFRNQPVGCTNTIIYSMFREQGVEIEPAIAGIMCCAILSDTLAFRSPTCTQLDIDTAHALAKIAGIDPMETAKEMFEAGERLDGKTAEDIVKTDYKIFAHGDTQFGVGQLSFMSKDSLKKAKELILPYLPEMQKKQRLDMVVYMLTSVLDESTETIWAGAAAPDALQKGFGIEIDGESAVLPGVVSRKKQFIPAVMKALATDEDDVYME